jgi:hypothetical protein
MRSKPIVPAFHRSRGPFLLLATAQRELSPGQHIVPRKDHIGATMPAQC